MIFFVPQNNYFLGDENIFQGWEILYVPKKYETARKAYTNYLKELAAGWVQTVCRSSRICTWSRTQGVPNKMNVFQRPIYYLKKFIITEGFLEYFECRASQIKTVGD